MKADREGVARRRGLAAAAHAGAVLAMALTAGFSCAALAQVPDNRDLRLDPEDSVPPAYRETLDERDRQRLDAAREAGETFLPVFQGPSASGDAGPAARRRAPAPPQTAYEAWRRPEPAPASGREGRGAGDRRPGGPRPEGLVGVLIEAWTRPPEIARLRFPAAARDPEPAAPGGMTAGAAGAVAQTARPILPRIAAGTGLYARTLYAVDSDYSGPVLLELLEPPLAGAVASGAFTRVGERLVLRLSRLDYQGRSLAVDAWAVGLDCACYGVDGDVDSHWFERVLLPSAVRFAEGFLTALSRPSETVVIGDDLRYERGEAAAREAVHAGLAAAARTAGDVLLESAPDRPTVRIARDTELVVVFAVPPDGAGEAGAAGRISAAAGAGDG